MTDAVFTRNALDPPAQVEPYPYGKPRFPNLDPRAYFDRQSQESFAKEPWHDGTGAYALAAMSLRPRSHTTSMQAFNPKAPAQPLPQRPEPAMSDNGWAQHVYEAALGRTRNPLAPNMPAAQGSGGGWGDPAKWILGGLGGWGGYEVGKRIFGDPVELWQEFKDLGTPGTPLYESSRKRQEDEAAARAGPDATQRAGWDNLYLSRRLGGGDSLPNRWRGTYEPDADKRAQAVHDYLTAGGVGNAPY